MNSKLSLLGGGLVIALALAFLRAGEPPPAGPATEQRFPPLKVPPGFKATLFACDPLIEYPSVISVGPKPGSIFVAVDYMSGTDRARKSEIRLVEDTDGDGYADKATVFAAGFNSIEGLAYHDGTVFVMHAPFLSALSATFKDGAVIAGERKDLLTGLGLTPEENPKLLHCANGVTVGHDGWLYLAMGDNGVNVARPEGDRLIFNGGGILRCRRDGRDLHVFSTGLRNIYDVALDAELNVFTRDNENDGGTYMIRVIHCFHGSDHGYPFLYDTRPGEAMPPLADLGLGTSAGCAFYLERQFPAEYRGNLFVAEWGRSIVRYPLSYVGGGFAPVTEFEFAAGDGKDTYPFKPTDTIVQRDGTLMVADYADGQRPKRGRGRIYHITYAGDESHRRKDETPRAESLAAQIDAESYAERWEAQLAIERGGEMPAWKDLGPRGRMHAIWALTHLDGAKAIEELLRIAKTDPEAGVRLQAVRAVADLADPILTQHKLDAGPGDAAIATRLAALAKGQDERVQMAIVVALGRLRWTDAPGWLSQILAKPDPSLQHAAMQTLRRADNWPAVLELLDQPTDAPIRSIALRALAVRHQSTVVDGLIQRLGSDPDPLRRREYADALARVYKKPGPWTYWGYRPGPKPANTEAWERTEAIEQALDRSLADPDRELRLAVLMHMQREKISVRQDTLGQWLKDEFHPERAAAILASLERPPGEMNKYADAVVRDRKHSTANRQTALAILIGEMPPDALVALAGALEDGPVLADVLRILGNQTKLPVASLLVGKLRSPDADVRAAAIEALGELGATEGSEPVLEMLQDKDVRVRRAAAGAAGKLSVRAANEPLLKLATAADAGVRLACLESLRQLREPRVVPIAVAALNERSLELKALACLGELGGPEQAHAVAEFAKRNPTIEGAAAAVRVLTAWRDRDGVAVAQRQELDRSVAEIQGTGGILLRWEASGAQPIDAKLTTIEGHAAIGKTPDHTGWRTLFATGAEARLTVTSADGARDSLWFASTDVNAAAEMPVEFLASSRGSLEIWLNGRSIYRRAEAKPFQIDSDRFTGTLDKGVNRILVQAGSSDAAVEFHLRFRRKSAKADHERLTQAALTRPGNAERGRRIFFDQQKSLCLTCHQLGNQGVLIGPELTGIGTRFSRIYVIESLLDPSRTIASSFVTLMVPLKNGEVLNGVKVAETETTVTLADNQGKKHQIAKANIANPSPISLMPEGLEQRFTQDEFIDLIAFLMSQKENRGP
jgi:putative membrane-bound dehydrogenase-like protein